MAKLGRLLLLAILSFHLVQAAQASLRFWIDPTSPFTNNSSFVAHELLQFAPPISSSGMVGVLRSSQPLNACTPPTGAPDPLSMLLIQGGGCDIEVKVRNARAAGYGAAVLYTNEDVESFQTSSSGTAYIPTISISQQAGIACARYALNRACGISADDTNTWYMRFLGLLAFLLVVALFVASIRFRGPEMIRQPAADPIDPTDIELGLRNLSIPLSIPQLEEQCPVVGYDELNKDEDGACVICLDEYEQGMQFRSLPCHHVFHAECIETWLTTKNPVCPICKEVVKPAQ